MLLGRYMWGQQNDDYYCVSLSTVPESTERDSVYQVKLSSLDDDIGGYGGQGAQVLSPSSF